MTSRILPKHALWVDGVRVCRLEVADRAGTRLRGLLGRGGLDGALLIERTSSVHTIGMRFTIDVALCAADMRVIEVTRMPPNRLLRPRRQVRAVLEAEAGRFAEWGLEPGSVLSRSIEPDREG